MFKIIQIKKANAFLASLLLGLFFISCKKSDTMSGSSSQTIGATVAAGSNFTLLKSAAIKAGLVTTLEGSGPFTVFAPTDDAFQASGITSATISSLPADVLKSVLLYHTLSAKVTSMQVPAGPNAKVVTAGGDSVFVTNNSKGVFVNGIQVTQADIPASNGVIHTIGKVLIPSLGQNLVQAVASDTSFSLLVAAVTRASQGSTNVAALLSTGGIFTVFAPTNSAFRAAGFPDTASINKASPATLTSILAYHVIAGRVFSSDLSNGATPGTLNGANVAISIAAGGSVSVKGNSNSTAANIIATNKVATNGVIHVIDKVLLP